MPNGVVQFYTVSTVSISAAQLAVSQNTTNTNLTLNLDGEPSGASFFVTVRAFTVAFGGASPEVIIIIRKCGMLCKLLILLVYIYVHHRVYMAYPASSNTLNIHMYACNVFTCKLLHYIVRLLAHAHATSTLTNVYTNRHVHIATYIVVVVFILDEGIRRCIVLPFLLLTDCYIVSFNHLYSLVFSCILLYSLVFPVTDLIQCLIVCLCSPSISDCHNEQLFRVIDMGR